jgi:hypothetical protein
MLYVGMCLGALWGSGAQPPGGDCRSAAWEAAAGDRGGIMVAGEEAALCWRLQ